MIFYLVDRDLQCSIYIRFTLWTHNFLQKSPSNFGISTLRMKFILPSSLTQTVWVKHFIFCQILSAKIVYLCSSRPLHFGLFTSVCSPSCSLACSSACSSLVLKLSFCFKKSTFPRQKKPYFQTFLEFGNAKACGSRLVSVSWTLHLRTILAVAMRVKFRSSS